MNSNYLSIVGRLCMALALLLTSFVVSQPTAAYAHTAASTLATSSAACTAPTTHTATGNDADSIRSDVDEFREAIGAINAPQPINHVEGRREINWDGAPDAVSAPNDFPGDFFNADVFPRARGIEFSAADDELYLSATEASGEGIEFDNFDPSYSSLFTVFSSERLFAPEVTNVVDVRFFSPADQTTPALVDSFGVIFTDVDYENVTKMVFYNQQDNVIYTLNAPAIPGNETLSLAGVTFDAPCIYRVRITTGNIGLDEGIKETAENGYDLVAMDDFIYGEPQPITSCGLPTAYAATGTNPAAIQADVDAYRAALGDANAPAPFNNLDGRRQIDWDGAPDVVSAPNSFPGNFFNADVFPRARGIAFTTEGDDFQLSATAASGAGVGFSNINATYAKTFQTFSAERLFTPIGSNVVQANFFNPAQQTTAALVDGFGAIFSDVDLDAQTTIAYYDSAGKLLYKQGVQSQAGSEGLSFAGVKFDSSCVSFVKLTSGTSPLGKDVNDDPSNGIDLVVMDDFIYGEPTTETVCGTPQIYTDTGADATAISDTVDAYRNALGDLNPAEPQNFEGGRRQIDWDGAPDGVSAPNAFPGDFFNFNAAPRARGIAFTTNGDGFQLSATKASNQGIEFDNINATYSATFDTFSPERLFSAIGSNEVDARFFNPATQTDSALTTGFGAVFSDVDLTNVTAIRYYDADNKLVYAQAVPTVIAELGSDPKVLSFAGLKFDSACVARVRLVSGNTPIAADVQDDPANGVDVVVMDDFIYGEPTPATVNVNAAINLTRIRLRFSPRREDNAAFGVITLKATFKNVGESTIRNLSFEVTELSHGNALLNATNGETGVGASFPLPADALGEDGTLTSGETFQVDFRIGLNRLRSFTFLVNAFGSVGGEEVDSLGWNYQVDVNPASVESEESEEELPNKLYLPLVIR